MMLSQVRRNLLIVNKLKIERIQRKGDPDCTKRTRRLPVSRPLGAMHANQLSCQFVLRFSSG